MSEDLKDTPHPVDAVILQAIEERGTAKTLCPTEVARKIDAENWRNHLKEVRGRAVRLAKAGEIGIYRKGKVIDPDQIKGVIRLGHAGEIGSKVAENLEN